MAKLYRLVFKGELLTGHDPAETRSRASQRLGANSQQTERLFSGQAVTLKRGLDLEAAARYAKELRELGMRMHVELDAAAGPKFDSDGARYRIVFQGELMPGFVPEQVKLAASERLHASAQQTAVLFSGRKTTLKKGLDAEQARRYRSRLRNIGMLVDIELESDAPVALPAVPVVVVSEAAASRPVASAADLRLTASHVETLIHTPLMQASDLLHAAGDVVDMDFTQTMVDHELIATNAQQALPDMEKTELAGEASLQAYMRGEPLPLAEEYIPPPQMPKSYKTSAPAASPEIGRDAVLVESAREAGIAQPVRNCAGCGARQPQGRYCIHCGHEFQRELRLPVVVAEEPLSWLRAQAASAAAAEEEANMAALARERNRNLLYLTLFALGLGVLTWWLRR